MKRWIVNWRHALVALVLLLCLGPVACWEHCGSCGHDEPAAPYDLAAEVFKSGIHLTWRDASDNEDLFLVERAARSSVAFEQEDRVLDLSELPVRPIQVQAFGHHFIEVADLPEDTEDYLDTDVYSGMTYFYRIRAVNDAGSSLSDEIEVAFP